MITITDVVAVVAFGLALAALVLWVLGGMMLFKGLIRLFNRKPPVPTFKNVDPSGPGWYRYSRGRWRRCEVQGYDGRARWLSSSRLLELALDAIVALRQSRAKKL